MKTTRRYALIAALTGMLGATIMIIALVMPVASGASANQQFVQPAVAQDNSRTVEQAVSPASRSFSEASAAAGRDTFVDRQWALDRIHVEAAWANVPASGVTVAVLDTGIDSQHEDLVAAIKDSVNLTSSPTAEDLYGHGTHVAGIIAARVLNGKGIAGAYPNVKLLNVKVANDNGDCSSLDVANGIVWAADHGADVINISLAITRPSANLEQAVDYAWNKGATIVAAAGNAKSPVTKVYPATYKNCIAVVGVDERDIVVTGYAVKETIAAPGYKVFSTLPGNKYGYKDGSSMATGYVSAAAAIAYARLNNSGNGGQINEKIIQVLNNSTTPIVSGMLTYNYIDFAKLVKALDH
jgi:subtilisin family serine protease